VRKIKCAKNQNIRNGVEEEEEKTVKNQQKINKLKKRYMKIKKNSVKHYSTL
jgi:hypothetical protein